MSLLEDPMHPGEVLKELYLDPLEMGAIAFARRLGVPRTRIERLIKGTTGITPDTALRLARVFNTTPAYWVNLQTNYDMSRAAKEIEVSDIEPLVTASLQVDPRQLVKLALHEMSLLEMLAIKTL